MNDYKGQSLLETVFALGILLFVVAAVLGLATSNVTSQDQTEYRFIATNLAREGIEVVRSVRDTNWLAGLQWSEGLQVGNSAIPILERDSESWNGEWRLDFSVDTLSDTSAILYNDAGVYNQSSIGDPTLYRRLLSFRNVCYNGSFEEIVEFGQRCDQLAGLEITSRVLWQERGRERSVELHDIIYGWK